MVRVCQEASRLPFCGTSTNMPHIALCYYGCLFGLLMGVSRIALPYNSDADAAYDFLVLLFDFDLCCKM